MEIQHNLSLTVPLTDFREKYETYYSVVDTVGFLLYLFSFLEEIINQNLFGENPLYSITGKNH